MGFSSFLGGVKEAFTNEDPTLNDIKYVVLPMIVMFIIARFGLKKLFGKLGSMYAKKYISEQYSKNEVRWKKFGVDTFTTFYLLVICSAAFLFFGREDFWFKNFDSLLTREVKFTPLMKLWYFVQIAYIAPECILHFIECGFFIDIDVGIHHLEVFMLMLIGFFWGPFYGIPCTFLHDFSNMFMKFKKVLTHLRAKNVQIAFSVINIVSWVYLRLYIFPRFLVIESIFLNGWSFNFVNKIMGFWMTLNLGLHSYWFYLIIMDFKNLLDQNLRRKVKKPRRGRRTRPFQAVQL